ncbi:MAG: SAM-dependent DNA methyltransferase, partial [Verrucomicrobia bacterium]|nr:SAM-dependent DNA methyltransferase [Verrucomicrobiota bacterium]
FTPPEISSFLVDWAIRNASETVLEPSCGEASFLLPAGVRLRQLGGKPPSRRQLEGVEVHAPSAAEAERLLKDAGFGSRVRVADFFDVEPEAFFDAVVGNPPYIRYQNFSGDLRVKALRAALTQGVGLTKLASSWAAFVVHATRFLKPGGRLALVLPAELLTVNYAAPVRKFLLRRFAKVRLVMFEELVFPGVLEEVVLLLAEGEGSAECFEVYQACDVSDLSGIDRKGWNWFTPESGGKWTPALVSADSFAEYQALVQGASFCDLLGWGETYLGAVTGNNRFFTMKAEQARSLRMPESALLRISPPGSRHLRGLTFTDAAWEEASKDGSPCYLFCPPEDRVGVAVQKYIADGESAGVQAAYKCQAREPWWRVPVVPVPDLLLTYMDHDRPRLITNAAKVAHLNSLYGVTLKSEHRQLGRDLLPIASLNSVTLLGAEMVGRSYGGGLLKLEPKEADLLPVPSPATVEATASELRALRPQLAKSLRQGKLSNAVDLVDAVLLRDHLSVGKDKIASLRGAREVLFSRRTSRGKGKSGKG